MASIVLGVLITGIIIYTSILFNSISLAMAGLSSAVLLVAACLSLLRRMHTIDGCIQVPISIAECGQPMAAHIFIKNKGFLSCPKFKCCVEQHSSFLKKRKRAWLRGQSALPGECSYDYRFILHNYGSYALCLKKIRIYDLTGLFYMDKTVNSSSNVQVLPKMQEIEVHLTEAVRNFYGDADSYDDFRPGHDNSELFQIRAFQNGDKIQSVHWKLSAKLDELLVKEDSMPKACPVVFMLDYTRNRKGDEGKVSAYLVVLASISFSLMDAGCPHYMVWYSGARKDAVRLRVDDEESLYVFLSCYLEEERLDSVPSLEEAYREKYKGEHFLYLLRLNGRLELYKNQDLIVSFSKGDWEQQLDGLALLL